MESRSPYATAPSLSPAVDMQAAHDWLAANVLPFMADPHRKVHVMLNFAGGKFGGGEIHLRDVRAGEYVLAGINPNSDALRAIDDDPA